jgi:hypothetical protein
MISRVLGRNENEFVSNRNSCAEITSNLLRKLGKEGSVRTFQSRPSEIVTVASIINS